MAPRKMEVAFPLRTVTGLNAREHWAARAKRVKAERTVTRLALTQAGVGYDRGGGKRYEVTLTRLSTRRCDGDNLQGALKAVRDEVAAWLGIDDGSDRVDWFYLQQKGRPGVRVLIRKERKGKPGPAQRFDRVLAQRMLGSGLSLAATGRAFGVSRQAVHRALKAAQ